MKTVEEVRLERLKQLIAEVGSAAELNRATGKVDRDSTYSQILNRSAGSKTGKPKEMGSPMARALESALHKPRGWMDTDPDLEQNIWPFSRISRERISALSAEDLGFLEGKIDSELERLDAKKTQLEPGSQNGKAA